MRTIINFINFWVIVPLASQPASILVHAMTLMLTHNIPFSLLTRKRVATEYYPVVAYTPLLLFQLKIPRGPH